MCNDQSARRNVRKNSYLPSEVNLVPNCWQISVKHRTCSAGAVKVKCTIL